MALPQRKVESKEERYMYDTSLPELPIFERVDERYRRLPPCLKSQRIWYPSKFTVRPDGSPGKPPCDRQGNFAKHWQYKSNWMSFDEAVGLNMDGVGIMLHKELGLTGIDFDHCVEEGVIIDPWVAQKVKELNSYTEYSVSGTGIHVLIWGRLPWKKCGGDKIEMYDRSRFLVMTGNLVPGTPTEIRNAQDTINAIHLGVFGSEEQISGKTALQQNQQVSQKGNTSFHGEERRRGKSKKEGAQRFDNRPAARLTQDAWVRLDNLRDDDPKFDSTWKGTRETSPWPFPSGRYTSSEYEASIAFFLVADGWDEQAIMDAITVWRRERGLASRTEYLRYAVTIGKAVSKVTSRPQGRRKEPKGLYRHGYTRESILSCVIETPRTQKQIAEYTGIDYPHVKVVIGRLRKDGMVIRDHHTYLCAPHAVPSYLRNIPEDAGEDSGEELITPEDARVDLDALEAEYAAAVAAGMFEEAVEEEIEAPLGFAPAAAVYIKPTLPDFDDYVEPELVTVEPAPIEYPAYDERDFGTYASRAAALAEWEVHWKQENRDRLREFRKRPNYNSPAALKLEAAAKKRVKVYASRYAPSQVDLDIARINEIARLKEKNNEVP